jgi:hypothetical protein
MLPFQEPEGIELDIRSWGERPTPEDVKRAISGSNVKEAGVAWQGFEKNSLRLQKMEQFLHLPILEVRLTHRMEPSLDLLPSLDPSRGLS